MASDEEERVESGEVVGFTVGRWREVSTLEYWYTQGAPQDWQHGPSKSACRVQSGQRMNKTRLIIM